MGRPRIKCPGTTQRPGEQGVGDGVGSDGVAAPVGEEAGSGAVVCAGAAVTSGGEAGGCSAIRVTPGSGKLVGSVKLPGAPMQAATRAAKVKRKGKYTHRIGPILSSGPGSCMAQLEVYWPESPSQFGI